MVSWTQQIEDDLRWREAELTDLKLLVASADPSSSRYLALLRALWCLLYAHYEGFTKFCWDLFLAAIEAEGLERQDLIEPFIQLSLEKAFKELRGNLSTPSLIAFIRNSFPSLLTSRVTFEMKLETNSNLWPNVFRDECSKINIACIELENHEQKLKSLVARRNDIAHGKRLIINTLSEYQKYEDAVKDVMFELALLIIECLDKKSFRI